MRPYRKMLVCLALGLVFAAGCGVDYGSGGSSWRNVCHQDDRAIFGMVGNADPSTPATDSRK